jgi:hypothetical protein
LVGGQRSAGQETLAEVATVCAKSFKFDGGFESLSERREVKAVGQIDDRAKHGLTRGEPARSGLPDCSQLRVSNV